MGEEIGGFDFIMYLLTKFVVIWTKPVISLKRPALVWFTFFG
jgi:hypothetical protein